MEEAFFFRRHIAISIRHPLRSPYEARSPRRSNTDRPRTEVKSKRQAHQIKWRSCWSSRCFEPGCERVTNARKSRLKKMYIFRHRNGRETKAANDNNTRSFDRGLRSQKRCLCAQRRHSSKFWMLLRILGGWLKHLRVISKSPF